ncbi:Trehalose synthase/amylase TreS [Anaerohalosphaera lusitana]|uniref:Maltokinase n=1 Tax=Anaerohalosphaera lusitana TaxID=1936003 RepID=A0A1U9NL47_9BACT|nr:maltose alpha-D-glucosyltransferase [Anaerohalosphaera lusitana]AQT68454.1 Trehalose synthase/amylase TreS [Anaerohalosphaera lusitana]
MPEKQQSENIGEQPLWYKDAVIYELHIKSFYDHDDDGIGDFKGLIKKLDYLTGLGVTAIWLLPFYPSPLMDDGYDISDYNSINPDYGSMRDFKQLLREAHKRGIRVITELVINHTSDQHKWFQRARRAKPGSVYRDFYVWSDTPEKYQDVRIIFTDFESSNWSWDPVAGAYYWHRFYKHQPDLNYDNPRVQKEILKAVDYWLGMGVDGLRLDAIPYLFEREGTNCENLPETHEFLKKLRTHVDSKFKDKMLLAEANQWPDDASKYFGDGDECHMAFHFPVMPRLFMAVRSEDRFSIIDMLDQSMDIPDNCQWAMFLRNHDELTLEMVTDEERDYMYKAYAQDPRARVNVGIRRRLAPLLENNRRKIELLNSLLLSLPGTPIIYYGDEIGMGDNYYLGDRDGVRTPMQWSPDRNAGFSKANPHKLYLPAIIESEYHYTTVNVESQSKNPSSLLWFMRKMIAVRKRYKAFGRGSFKFVNSDNPKVLTFMREYDDETLFVVANLSRHCQVTNIDLAEYENYTMEEVFSGNKFPDINEDDYTLTITPHTFYWFSLSKPAEGEDLTEGEKTHVELNTTWGKMFDGGIDEKLSPVLTRYIKRCRWFGAKGKTIRRINLRDSVNLQTEDGRIYMLFLDVVFRDQPKQTYFLPVGFATDQLAHEIQTEYPGHVITGLSLKKTEGWLYEAVVSEGFQRAMLAMLGGRRNKATKGRLRFERSRKFKELMKDRELPLPSELIKAEQSNSSIIYDDAFFMKLYRRIEEGLNPDVELSWYLTEKTDYKNLPAFAGSYEWQKTTRDWASLGVLLEYVHSENDAWTYSLDAAGRYFSYVTTNREKNGEIPECPASIHDVEYGEIPDVMRESIGSLYLENVWLLGKRIGEMHLALASLTDNKDVRPESYSLLYQKSLYQSIRSLTIKVFDDLTSHRKGADEQMQKKIDEIIGSKRSILSFFRRLSEKKISAKKIRVHGDLHLGQVLYTGKDFVVIDFEGEPARTISERRLKRSALRDVAGMIRSFHYSIYGSIFLRLERQGLDIDELKPWVELWYHYVSGTFLQSYRETVAGSDILPGDEDDFRLLLDVFLLEKAVYELGYEINNRPDWLTIPVRGIGHLLENK